MCLGLFYEFLVGRKVVLQSLSEVVHGEWFFSRKKLFLILSIIYNFQLNTSDNKPDLGGAARINYFLVLQIAEWQGVNERSDLVKAQKPLSPAVVLQLLPLPYHQIPANAWQVFAKISFLISFQLKHIDHKNHLDGSKQE